MPPRDLAAYLFLALAWGSSFLVLLVAVKAFGWVGAVTLRCFIAAAALFLVARVAGLRLDFAGRWRDLTVVGATTVAGQLIGLSYGTPLIGTAMSAILVATIPLFSMIIGEIWGLEKITAQGMIGLVIGTLGILLLVGFPAVPVTPMFLIGCASTLAASFSAAFGSNYARRHLSTTGSMALTTGAFLTGGVMTLPLLLLVPLPGLPGALDWLALLVLGAGMSALTYVLYFRLVATLGATRTISVEFVVTVVAVLIGALLLDETFGLLQLLGATIVLLGSALVLGLFPSLRRRQPAGNGP